MKTEIVDVIVRRNTEKLSFVTYTDGSEFVPEFIAIAKTPKGEKFERENGDPDCRIDVPRPRCRKAKGYYVVNLKYDFGPQFGRPAKPNVVVDFCGQIMKSTY